jgi:putative ABC transport system permease protein
VQIGLPYFNQVTGKNINFESGNIFFIIAALIIITLVTGVIAGSYPAFYLSSFEPASVLKGKSALQSSHSFMRRSLVVFQFVIAICLVCGMIIISKQLNFIQEKNLGFNSSHKIVLPLRTETAQKNYGSMEIELGKLSSVNKVTATNYIPGSPVWSDFQLYTQGGNMETATHFRNNWVEPNYISVLGIKLIAGRNFSENRATDAHKKVLINREGAKQLGFTPETVLSQNLYFDWHGETTEFEVIGVMEDYHQVSLKEKIYPLLFRIDDVNTTYPYAIVDVDARNLDATIASCEQVWKTLNSDTPFEYSFLDENIQKQYDEDKKIASVISGFTIIAMIISCLGLYGLSTYMAERRFKEIGVRKVMGASVQQIVSMMSGEFMKLVCIAFVIAVPLSWYAIGKWLEGFAYKTSVDATIFIYAGLAAGLIALVTVSFESIRAATGNPVKALRNE